MVIDSVIFVHGLHQSAQIVSATLPGGQDELVVLLILLFWLCFVVVGFGGGLRFGLGANFRLLRFRLSQQNSARAKDGNSEQDGASGGQFGEEHASYHSLG